MIDTHPGDTARLTAYWAHGEGAAKIGWGQPGDFAKCELELGKYVPPEDVKGLCANLHHDALGIWPATHAKQERGKAGGMTTEADASPYGDVTYADPGYQKDGVKRYPLDSADHCRAAWSYINMPKNAALYSAADLAKVKAKIVAALKKYGVKVDPEEANEAVTEAVTEAVDRVDGHVLEAKEPGPDGGRIFRMRVINYGQSRNGRNYPRSVMEAAAPLYNGAKVFDHHRTDEELKTSTIKGLIGHLANVEATSEGIDADLHLLPGATHAGEALAASLAAPAGAPPIAGMSHDVMAHFRAVDEGGRRRREATAITKVNSADVVVEPAAGGRAVRAVAGGIDVEDLDPEVTESTTEEGNIVDLTAIREAVEAATPEDRAAFVALFGPPTPPAERAREADPEPEPEPAREALDVPKESVSGRILIRMKADDAKLTEKAREALTRALPDRITEADIDELLKARLEWIGTSDIPGSTAPTAEVTQEAFDKKVTAFDDMLAGKQGGYRSIKAAFVDITGKQPRAFDEDFSRLILRESMGTYDSSVRSTESLVSTSWNTVLGDSVTRRLVALYNQPNLQTWRQIVSSIVPVNDFRTQRLERVGGYGVLPAVNQGATYNPLTSPTNEEATYTVTKRGGTEDVTLEMVANDDVRSLQLIPTRLALAASQTIYRFVWDFLNTNPTIYDSTALFAAGHANTTSANPLGQSTLSAARKAMRKQSAYGDAFDILSIVPKLLVVPSTLEEIAFQLTRSAVAIPATPAGPSNTPNIHDTLDYVVVDYFDATSTTQWYIVGDPSMVPTMEVGFYQGQQDPQLFTQSDPSVGSMFDADKVTYKIRHIYSGAILDYRGFQRGVGV